MPGRLSSPVCLTVIWFLSWSLHASRAQIQTDEVSDVQFGRLESNVTLECGKSQIRSPVVWRHNHSSVLAWHQVASDGRLALFHVDQSAQGNYSCYDDSGLLLHSVILRLGYPPGLLSISCRVPNHTHVRCFWRDSVETFLPAKYNVSFRANGKEWRPCILDWSYRHCDVQDPPFWQKIHTLGVTETNALGSQTTETKVRLNDLLKPDPPQSVSIQEVEGYATQLRVSWSIPSSWPEDDDAFTLLFQIRYRPHGSNHWSEIFTDKGQTVVISDALEGHVHQVQVRARDEFNSDSQWSEWSPLSLVTPWKAYTSPDPSDDPDPFDHFSTKPETSTLKAHSVVQGDEGNLGLVILLVLFSIFILTTVLSLIFVIWMRQKRREHATKQELASMVKMKSMPI